VGEGSTRDRILTAGEALFAEVGFEGATLRRLTTTAEVNLAAVHYHFGNKEGLFRAVLERRLAPINAERLRRLDLLESRSASPSLEEVVEAFVGPMLSVQQDPRAVAFVRRLLGRICTDQGGEWIPHFLAQFSGVKERFAVAFQRALPALSPAEVAWRMHFSLGATAHAIADETRIAALSDGLCDPRDSETLLAELVRFITGGLRAPQREERS
jgi:AcrR family transcriptional regulator